MCRCHVCGRGPADRKPTTVFRQNAKGKPGIWACDKHRTYPVSEDLRAITDALEGYQAPHPMTPER